jgi:hypothetical protein
MFVFAVTAQGQIGVVREGSEDVQFAGSIGVVHLGAKFAFEFVETFFVRCGERFFDEFGAG